MRRMKEALSADLVGFLEKKRFKNFLVFVQEFSDDDPATWKDVYPINTVREVSMNTASFIVNWLGYRLHNWLMLKPQ